MTVSTEQTDLQHIVQLVRQGAEANERPDLVRRMRLAAEAADGGGTAAVAAAVIRSLESLEVDLRTRRAALGDPGRDARLAAESRHAETRLHRFRERAAKWPRALGDALAAADSDLEYALHSRMRSLLDDGTAVIESRGDVAGWLTGRLVTEAEECQEMVRSAVDVVAERVADVLQMTVALPPKSSPPGSPRDLVARLPRSRPARPDGQPLATRLLGVVMPTYSGMMVALVLPRLVGLRLPLWVLVAVAVAGAAALGGAALAGERQRQVSRRNAEADGELRSAVDAFRMALGKQMRDGVRAVEQQLHAAADEAVAAETRRLSAAASDAAAAAGDSDRTEQALADIDADLESIRDLRDRAGRHAQRP